MVEQEVNVKAPPKNSNSVWVFPFPTGRASYSVCRRPRIVRKLNRTSVRDVSDGFRNRHVANTQFFRSFRPARGRGGRLRSGRPARDQYESRCPGGSYPARLVVFARLRLAGAALVLRLLSVGRRGVRRAVMFAGRGLCGRDYGTLIRPVSEAGSDSWTGRQLG